MPTAVDDASRGVVFSRKKYCAVCVSALLGVHLLRPTDLTASRSYVYVSSFVIEIDCYRVQWLLLAVLLVEPSWNRQQHAAAAAARSTCCGSCSADVLREETTTPARNTIRHPFIRAPRNFSVGCGSGGVDSTEALKQGRRLPSTCSRTGCDVNAARRQPLTDLTQSCSVAHHECAINQLLATVASRRRPSHRRAISAATIYRSLLSVRPSVCPPVAQFKSR